LAELVKRAEMVIATLRCIGGGVDVAVVDKSIIVVIAMPRIGHT